MHHTPGAATIPKNRRRPLPRTETLPQWAIDILTTSASHLPTRPLLQDGSSTDANQTEAAGEQAPPAQHNAPAQHHPHLHHQHLDATLQQADGQAHAAAQQLDQAQQQQQHEAAMQEPAEAAQQGAHDAAAHAAAEEAAAEARRQSRLEVERQLELAEDLVGFAVDERQVDVARGVALLQDMAARWVHLEGRDAFAVGYFTR